MPWEDYKIRYGKIAKTEYNKFGNIRIIVVFVKNRIWVIFGGFE
jgi:hypothetical protein